MNVRAPTFEWKMTFGNIITIATVSLGALGAYSHFLWTVGDIQHGNDATRSMVLDMAKAEGDRAAKYIPMIEGQNRSSDVQDQRIQNMVGAITDLRSSVNDLAKVVAQTHEDIAVLKTRQDRQGERQDRQGAQQDSRQ